MLCRGKLRPNLKLFGVRGSIRNFYLFGKCWRKMGLDFGHVLTNVMSSIAIGLITPAEGNDWLELAIELSDEPYSLTAMQIADHFQRKAQMINLMRCA